MNFYPCNRHILLEKIGEEKKEEPVVLLPDDYTPSKEEFGSYTVVRGAPDCNLDIWPEEIILVENNMVKELKFADKTYLVILENYVFGSLSGERENWDDWENDE